MEVKELNDIVVEKVQLNIGEKYIGNFSLTFRPESNPEQYRFIKDSMDMYNFIRPEFEDVLYDHEIFIVVHLNIRNKVIGYTKLGVGSSVGVVVDTRRLLRDAILLGSKNVTVIHNHPTGSLVPSDPDVKIKNNIKECLKLIECSFMDFMIVGGSNYYSAADSGNL